MSNLTTMLNDIALTGMSALVTADVTTLLNKVQREEIEGWDWSFSYTNIVINSFAPVQINNVSVINGSSTMTYPSALIPIQPSTWFLWVGGNLTTPLIVNTIGSTSLTTTTPYVGTSGTTQIVIQPLYYSVTPLIEVVAVRQIDYLTQTSRDVLNRIDPSRLSTGGAPALRWAQAPWNSPVTNGQYQIELWPRPSSALPYLVEGKMGSIDMVAGTDLPLIPSAVLEAKTMMYLARSLVASNGSPKWAQLAEMYKTDYERELLTARTADERRKVTLGKSASGAGDKSVNLGMDYIYKHDAAGPPYIGA